MAVSNDGLNERFVVGRHLCRASEQFGSASEQFGKESDAMSFSFDEKTYFGVLLALPLRERYYFSSLGPTAGSVSLTRTNRLRYRALLFELAFVPGPNI